MALSGSVSTTAYNDGKVNRYLTLSWTATQNVANNSSTVSWRLWCDGLKDYYVEVSEVRVTIDGSQEYYRNTSNHTKGYYGVEIASGTKTIYHNTDGTRSFSVLVEAGIYVWAINCSGSKTFTLDTIPRKSPISVSGAFTMGSSGRISISSASTAFRHTVTCLWGDTTASGISAGKGYKLTIVSKSASTSIDWTPPLDLAKVIPNDTHGVGSLVCDTYVNDVLVGTTSTTFIANVPTNIIPSVSSFVAERVNNGVPDNWGLYIQSKSQCKLTASGVGSYGSTITGYSIKRNNAVISSDSTGTTSVLNESGNITFTAYVTDSRGRTGSKDVTIYVTPYFAPTVTSILSQRSTANGTLDDNGVYIRTSCEYTIASCGEKNTSSCKVYYRKSGDTYWSNGVSITPASPVVIAGNADVDSSYEVKYELSDALSTVTFNDMVSTSFTTLDLKKGGKGVAIGKASEKECFECAMDAEFTGAFSANLSGLFVRETFVPDSHATINPNAVADTVLDITKEGYTPIAISGVHTSHGSALLVVAQLMSSTQAKVTVRNVNTVAITIAPSAEILFLKNI
jgi:hypothetical protein